MEAFLTELDQIAPLAVMGVFFILGAIVGSFLNVCIYRVPKGKSIVFPGSQCACGEPVKWHDNVPILGWLLLGGRARCCGRSLPIRYPLVELLTAVLFALLWWLREPLPALAGMVFVSFMIAVFFVDLDEMIIPDAFSVGGTLVGLILSVALPTIHDKSDPMYLMASLHSLGVAMLGLAIGSALILWIKIFAESLLNREAMGEGDIVLMGAIGSFCGWQGAVFALFGGAVIGSGVVAILALVRVLFRSRKAEAPEPPAPNLEAHMKKLLERNEAGASNLGVYEEEVSDGRQVPFGPMLAGAAVLYFIVLHEPVDAYFASLHAVLASPTP